MGTERSEVGGRLRAKGLGRGGFSGGRWVKEALSFRRRFLINSSTRDFSEFDLRRGGGILGGEVESGTGVRDTLVVREGLAWQKLI